MRRTGLTLCVAALVALAAMAAPAQTACPVAQLISPTPGSTLPAGAVTFEWCNANAEAGDSSAAPACGPIPLRLMPHRPVGVLPQPRFELALRPFVFSWA